MATTTWFHQRWLLQVVPHLPKSRVITIQLQPQILVQRLAFQSLRFRLLYHSVCWIICVNPRFLFWWHRGWNFIMGFTQAHENNSTNIHSLAVPSNLLVFYKWRKNRPRTKLTSLRVIYSSFSFLSNRTPNYSYNPLCKTQYTSYTESRIKM